ncbi:MAG: long-chain fatty acid--CoA ligase, partial [Actinobacteria bacterium]
MDEYTAPNEVNIADDDNVIAALLENAKTAPNRPALAYREGDSFIDVSTADFASTVRELAAGLIGLGIEPGDRVCIFMKTRIEFTYLDYAIWCVGATTVTIYETSSAEQVEWIVSDSEAVAIICGNPELRARFESISEQTPDCRHVLTVGAGAIDGLRESGENVNQSA